MLTRGLKMKALIPISGTAHKFKSVHPSSNLYVIQAYDFTQNKWQDTVHGGETPEKAGEKARALLDNDACWMGDDRVVRVVERVAEISEERKETRSSVRL